MAKEKSKFFWGILISYSIVTTLIIVFIFSFLLGHIQGSLNPASGELTPGELLNFDKKTPEYLSKDVDFQEFWRVWKYVKDNYVKPDVSDNQLFYGAMAGIVASLKDPYSVFLNPEVSKKFDEELAGSFEGIGAEIGLKDERLTIIAPLPGTPAEKAGLAAGDRVLAIDGKDTTGIALDYAVNIIRGPKGTQVKLTVLSSGSDEPRELTITRDKIDIDSVKFTKQDTQGRTEKDKGFSLKDGNIAYIQLLYFNENTLADWDKNVQAILAENPKGIILDLRNNPGGYLSTAIEVAGEWVD